MTADSDFPASLEDELEVVGDDVEAGGDLVAVDFGQDAVILTALKRRSQQILPAVIERVSGPTLSLLLLRLVLVDRVAMELFWEKKPHSNGRNFD